MSNENKSPAPEAACPSPPNRGPTGGRRDNLDPPQQPRNRGGRPTVAEAARRLVAKELGANRTMLPAMIERMRTLVLTGGPSVAVQAEQSLARLEARARRELARAEEGKAGADENDLRAMMYELCSWKLMGWPRTEDGAAPTEFAHLPVPELVASLKARREALEKEERALEEKAAQVRELHRYLEQVERRPISP